MIAFFVIPAFFAAAILSILLASRSEGFRTAELSPSQRVLLNVVGFLAAVILTLFAVWAVPESNNNEWEELINQIGVVILGPLVLGVALLVLRSLTQNLRALLASLAAGALFATIPNPVIAYLASSKYRLIQGELALDSLCKNAFVESIERVGQVKSVAFLPDSFVGDRERDRYSVESISISSRMLQLSLLESIERPSTSESGLRGKAKYERVTIDGKRVPISQNSNEYTKFRFEPIEEISAEYIVRPEHLFIENGQKSRLGGARIEIFRREDKKLISHARYYWYDNFRRSCPVETRAGIDVFVYKFIAESLGIVDLLPDLVRNTFRVCG